jgi:hypothetical protein
MALMAVVLLAQCNMALLLTHALKCQQLRKSKVVMVTITVSLKKPCKEPYDISGAIQQTHLGQHRA